MRLPVLVALSALVICACGGTTTVATTTTDPVTTTTKIASSTTTGDLTTTTSVAMVTTTSAPPPLVEIVAGQVTGPQQIEAVLGDTVEFRVLSDVEDEVHVHGYDLTFQLDAGVPLDISLVADVPGVFEVEVHNGHAHILEIRVDG